MSPSSEGAGDRGYTVAKALQLLRNNQFDLGPHTLVIVDEAAMIGTPELRELLTATTAAGAKTVLVGDQHQLAPVKARGGMFAQLCGDLPWAQHLSAVWRMRDPDERTASLALRDGGPAGIRRAIGWYRTHGRLHCGDQITMADDALADYTADIAAGKDALLICDTTEMTDALNQRLHHDTIAADAPTVTGARGHRLAAGDLILTRHNDTSIPLRNNDNAVAEESPVRNGQRWQVTHINPDSNRLVARRLDDYTLAAFPGDYVRDHITYGYAVTVHAAQGATAHTTHAVLGETASRALAYVAMTRGRETNTVYLSRRATEQQHRDDPAHPGHVAERGSGQQAATLLRGIIAHDDRAATAHDIVATTPAESLPARVRAALQHRALAVHHRKSSYQHWRAEVRSAEHAARTARSRDTRAERSAGDWLEY